MSQRAVSDLLSPGPGSLMRIPPIVIATARRWAASWWSLGFQLGTLVFYSTAIIALVLHRGHYERGVIPVPLFQFWESDGVMFIAMDPGSAMREWYFLVIYFGFAVAVLPFSIWACWRLRCVLRRGAVVMPGTTT